MAFPAGSVGLVLGDVAEDLRGLDDRIGQAPARDFPDAGRGLA
jgi:hypothetical protein